MIETIKANPIVSLVIVCSVVIPSTASITSFFYSNQLSNTISKYDAQIAMIKTESAKKLKLLEISIAQLKGNSAKNSTDKVHDFKAKTTDIQNPSIVSHVNTKMDYGPKTIFVISGVFLDKNGKLQNLTMEKSKSVKDDDIAVNYDLLPERREDRIPQRNEIHKFAELYDLTKPSKENPSLRFKEGDIAYWSEQQLSVWEIQLEFYSRSIVLKTADLNNALIPSQGDLSHFAQKLYPSLYEASREKWKLKINNKL